MSGRNRNLKIRHSLWVVLCFLCCALITLSGIVQAGHIHADGQAVQTDCALCHVAHLVVQPAAPQPLPRAVRLLVFRQSIDRAAVRLLWPLAGTSDSGGVERIDC